MVLQLPAPDFRFTINDFFRLITIVPTSVNFCYFWKSLERNKKNSHPKIHFNTTHKPNG